MAIARRIALSEAESAYWEITCEKLLVEPFRDSLVRAKASLAMQTRIYRDQAALPGAVTLVIPRRLINRTKLLDCINQTLAGLAGGRP